MRLDEIDKNGPSQMDVDDALTKFGIALCYRPQLYNLIASGKISLDMSDDQIKSVITSVFRR